MLLDFIRKSLFSKKAKITQTPVEREALLNEAVARAVQISETGDLDAALAAYEKILADEPESLLALHGMALLSIRKGRYEQGYAIARELTERLPGQPEAWTLLALSSRGLGLLDEALEAAYRSIALREDVAMISCGGVILFHLGRIEESVKAFEQALRLHPNDDSIHSNRLFALSCMPSLDRTSLLKEHLDWGRQVELRIEPMVVAFGNIRNAERRLRIGYVSADLRHHPVATLLEPILRNHDKTKVEVYCYDAQVGEGDAVTRSLRTLSDHWINCSEADDVSLAKRIVQDSIDILVDLSGHTAGNRLPVFAMRPAPVQVSWFGYMSTTGLTRIDYRFSDFTLCPPGAESGYSEKIYRLPTMVAWAPHPDSPPLNSPPITQNGFPTFGSFNNWSKVTASAISCWSAILKGCTNAKLRIIAAGGDTLPVKASIESAFKAHDIDPGRLIISGTTSLLSFLKIVQETDIALDPFPYNGGTTSFHCLWMGVPIVSLSANEELGRAGFGILHSVGLGDLCANDESGYVKAAIALAGDPERLGLLRRSLRDKLSGTPVMDARSVTQEVEKAFTTMWQTWLAHDAARLTTTKSILE